MQIVVIDYGRGNLHSVLSGLEHAIRMSGLVVNLTLTSDPKKIEAADKVVFPGVGAMGDCYQQLLSSGLESAVKAAFFDKPFLGICVGMQVLFDSGSENSGSLGLGLVSGHVDRFKDSPDLKVPHIGWSPVSHQNHPLFAGIPQGARFYFVHSYKVNPKDQACIQATCDYGQSFPAAVGQANWFATQFHPEKSHQWGLCLLKNFIQWSPQF